MMADPNNRRRRYGKPKKQDERRPFILAKRETATSYLDGSQKQLESEIQPKILLKAKDDTRVVGSTASPQPDAPTGSGSGSGSSQMQKTIIVTRTDNAQSPCLNNMSPNTVKDTMSLAGAATTTTDATQPPLLEPVPQMTRPATVISSTGYTNSNVRKLLLKNNTDFFVVGVVGMQGVGKSTIMNLLANENPDCDYYRRVFEEQDTFFPTKLKLHKCSSRSRTESTHMFVTKDRMILIDSPPVLCNSYKKDMITNELDDIRNIITLLSVCHLLIVVQDDYFSMNFVRLLHFAELMKPAQDHRPLASDYFPNVLFVKNRAKRMDFMAGRKERTDRMLRHLFKDSPLRLHVGQTMEQQQRMKKTRAMEAERLINSFLLPEVKGREGTSYHAPLNDIVEELRNIVFMTPRSEMHAGSTDLTETAWFDLLAKMSADSQHFFFSAYEEIQRKHLDVSISDNNGPSLGMGTMDPMSVMNIVK